MRKPAVSGQFYAYQKQVLEQEIDKYLNKTSQPEIPNPKALIVPHAGYMYSGQTAAYSYSAIPRSFEGTFVIAGPNHTGMGEPLSLSLENWETPLGVAENDQELAEAIKQGSSIVESEVAHVSEHSIEVQLPFLQRLFKRVKFVPICMGDQSTEAARTVANAVHEAALKLKRKLLFIASSDFTHFQPAERAKRDDEKAIEFIKQLKDAEFQNYVLSNNISICGHGPIAAAIAYAKSQGAKQGKLLNYSNSGAASGDYGSVVAYASIALV